MADIASFQLDATYTVEFDTSRTNFALEVINGNVTFDLNGSTYTLTNGLPADIGISGIGQSSARLRLTDGIMSVGIAGADFQIGEGEFNISTSGQLGTSTTKPDLYASSGGSSRLVIDSNGKAMVDTMSLGVFSGMGGSALVTGPQASLSVENTAFIGDFATGDLTLTDGASASFGGPLIVGHQREGHLIVTDGGKLMSGSSASLGEAIDGLGLATVSGSGSHWSASSIEVGNGGIGELIVKDGGELTSNTLSLGVAASSTGVADFVEAGTRVGVIDAIIAGSGNGSLRVRESAKFELAGNLQINNPAGAPIGTVEIDGGQVYIGGNFSNNGTLKFTDGLLRVAGSFQPHAAAAAAYTINGGGVDDLPVLELIGSGVTSNITQMTVGTNRRGQLLLRQERVLSPTDLHIGALPGGEGVVTVESGAELQADTLNIGGLGTTSGGSGTFNITDATVIASTLRLFSDGKINFNSGQFFIGSIPILSGELNWISGELTVSALPSITEFNAMKLLGLNRTIHSGQKLSTFGAVAVNTPIVVDGGHLNLFSLTNNSTLDIHRGTAEGTTLLTNRGFIHLNGPLAELRGSMIQNEHTIRGSGIIDGQFINTSSGQVQLIGGERLRLAGISNSNSGHLSILGGELQVDHMLTNVASTGLISARDAILRFTAVTNEGSMAFSNGTVDIYGDIKQNPGGRITVSNGGIANFYDDVTITAGAANVQATALGSTISRVVFFGSYNGGVTGGGQAFIEGDHRPGNSPALVEFGGDVSYGPFSSLEIELAGETQGALYDAVAVSGEAVLGGELDVTLLGGFSPALGSVFEILTATGGVTGVFENETLPSLGPLLTLHTFYESNAVNLVVVPALEGDYNADGIVNAADYTIFRDTHGQTGAGLAADGNHSGMIDNGDRLVWAANFGSALGSGAGYLGGVPEPATLCLMMMGFAGAMMVARNKKVEITVHKDGCN